MTVNVYILLDRSGSMASRWDEALVTINSYVEELAKAGHEGAVTCAAFDQFVQGATIFTMSGCTFDVLRKAVRPQDWKPLSKEDAHPRGNTPLYDAIGRLNGLASADANPKGILVVMTDGAENASREITKIGAKAMLDQQRARGWQVVHLGVEFDAFSQAADVGTQYGSTMTLGKGGMKDGETSKILRRETQLYASGATASMSFNADDRVKAARPDDAAAKTKAARQ